MGGAVGGAAGVALVAASVVALLKWLKYVEKLTACLFVCICDILFL